MLANVFNGNLLADNVAGHNVNTLLGERSALACCFNNLQLHAARGYNVGGFTNGAVICKSAL